MFSVSHSTIPVTTDGKTVTACTPRVGDRVRVKRDETRYPTRGSWPRFRGRTGTVIEINPDRRRSHLTEYAVAFGKVSARTNNGSLKASGIAWFKVYEIAALAYQRHAEPFSVPIPIAAAGYQQQPASVLVAGAAR
jgi:hypothetical protein